jgi:hypothetical protein
MADPPKKPDLQSGLTQKATSTHEPPSPSGGSDKSRQNRLRLGDRRHPQPQRILFSRPRICQPTVTEGAKAKRQWMSPHRRVWDYR